MTDFSPNVSNKAMTYQLIFILAAKSSKGLKAITLKFKI